MESLPVIEYFDIIEDIPSCFFAGMVFLMMCELGLQRVKEAFHWGVVPTVAFSAHTRLHPVFPEQFLVLFTCVLAAAIRMMQEPISGIRSAISHRKRICNEIGLHSVIHGPSGDTFGTQIHHRGQIQPPFVCRYVRDIRRPHGVLRINAELSIKTDLTPRVTLAALIQFVSVLMFIPRSLATLDWLIAPSSAMRTSSLLNSSVYSFIGHLSTIIQTPVLSGEDQYDVYRNTKHFNKFKISAIDGDVGTLHDLYFDDYSWLIRYFIVDTDGWLMGRRVLLSPTSIDTVDWDKRVIHVKLTKEQVEQSPDVDLHEPLSVLQLQGTNEVEGYKAHAEDGLIGRVQDFLVDDVTWTIGYLVVNTGDCLPGKLVLLPPAWISGVHWPEAIVHTCLTKSQFETAPEYDRSAPLTQEYEKELYEHYGSPKHWHCKA